MTLIAAQPGWRVCVFSREQCGAIALEIVAWESRPFGEGAELRPWVLSENGERVAPLSDDEWFVAILPPGSELADYIEAAEQVAKAEEEAEERRERERIAAR